MQKFQLYLKIFINKYLYWLALKWCPKLHIIICLSILKILRFGDVDLAVKLTHVNLCVTYYIITKNFKSFITNLQTFLLIFTFGVGSKFDSPYLYITIQEVAKFNIFLKYLFFVKGLTYIFNWRIKKLAKSW